VIPRLLVLLLVHYRDIYQVDAPLELGASRLPSPPDRAARAQGGERCLLQLAVHESRDKSSSLLIACACTYTGRRAPTYHGGDLNRSGAGAARPPRMSIWSRMFTNMKKPAAIETISQPILPPAPAPEPPLSSPTCVVHTSSDALPPQLPGWTRFVCVSDTHAHTFSVPAGDVLLHAGDLTNTGTLPEMRTTVEWLGALPHPVKMCVRVQGGEEGRSADEGNSVIAGNHDLPLHQADGWYAANWERWHRGAPGAPPSPLFSRLHALTRRRGRRAAARPPPRGRRARGGARVPPGRAARVQDERGRADMERVGLARACAPSLGKGRRLTRIVVARVL
jgi:hypothetical protein